MRLEHGQGCILIERWTLADVPQLRNMARRDTSGGRMWRGDLPATPCRKCFVVMRRIGDAVLATTFQGAELLLGLAKGAHLNR